jgi:hypothetical protein
MATRKVVPRVGGNLDPRRRFLCPCPPPPWGEPHQIAPPPFPASAHAVGVNRNPTIKIAVSNVSHARGGEPRSTARHYAYQASHARGGEPNFDVPSDEAFVVPHARGVTAHPQVYKNKTGVPRPGVNLEKQRTRWKMAPLAVGVNRKSHSEN